MLGTHIGDPGSCPHFKVSLLAALLLSALLVPIFSVRYHRHSFQELGSEYISAYHSEKTIQLWRSLLHVASKKLESYMVNIGQSSS